MYHELIKPSAIPNAKIDQWQISFYFFEYAFQIGRQLRSKIVFLRQRVYSPAYMRQDAFGFELINLPVNGFFGQGGKLFLDKRK